MSIQNRPTARQIQPIAFPGRLDEITPPTIGKESKGAKSATSLMRPEGGSSAVSKVTKARAAVAPNMTTPSPASDQASQAARALVTPTPPPSCSFDSFVITPPYRKAVP